MSLGQSPMLETYDRRSAVSLKGYFDAARAGRKSRIAVESPGKHDAVARQLDECASGAISPSIRLIEFKLQLSADA